MILDRRAGARRWLALACTAGAIGVIVLACQTPEPQSPEVAVREALGIVAEPPPPPPPPAPSEIGAIPFQAFNKVSGAAYSAEDVERHADLRRKLASERVHGVLLDEEKRMPPPPPPRKVQ